MEAIRWGSRGGVRRAAAAWERDGERALPPRRKDSEASSHADRDKERDKAFPFEIFLRDRLPRRRKFASETGFRRQWSNNNLVDVCKKNLQNHRSSKAPVRKLLGVPHRSGQKSLLCFQDRPRRLRSFSSTSMIPLFFRRSESENNIGVKKFTDSKHSDNRRNTIPRHTSESILLATFNPKEYIYEPTAWLLKCRAKESLSLEKKRTSKCKSEFQFRSWNEKRDNLDSLSTDNIVKHQKNIKPSLPNIQEHYKEEKRLQKMAQKISNKNVQKNYAASQKEKNKKMHISTSGVNTKSDCFENHKKSSSTNDIKSIENTTYDSTYSSKMRLSCSFKNTLSSLESSEGSNSRDSRESGESITQKENNISEIKKVEAIKVTQINTNGAKHSLESKIGTVTNNAGNMSSSGGLNTYTCKIPSKQTHQSLIRKLDKNSIKQTFQNIIEAISRESEAKIENTHSPSKLKYWKRDTKSNVDIFADVANIIIYNTTAEGSGHSPDDLDSKIQPSDTFSQESTISQVNPSFGSIFEADYKETSQITATEICQNPTSNMNSSNINGSDLLVQLGCLKNTNEKSIESRTRLKKSNSKIQDGITVSTDECPLLSNLARYTNFTFEESMKKNEFLESNEGSDLEGKKCTESLMNSKLLGDIQTKEFVITIKQGRDNNESIIYDIYNNKSENVNTFDSTLTSNYSDKSISHEVTKITKQKISKHLEHISDTIELSKTIIEDGTGEGKFKFKMNAQNNLNDNDHDNNQNTLNTEMDLSLDSISDKSAISDFIISNDKSCQALIKNNSNKEAEEVVSMKPSEIVNMKADQILHSLSMSVSEEMLNTKSQDSSWNKQDCASFKTSEELSVTILRRRCQSQRLYNTPHVLCISASKSNSCSSREADNSKSRNSKSQYSSKKESTGCGDEKFNFICGIYLDETCDTVEIKENLKEKLPSNTEFTNKVIETTNNASIQCTLSDTSNTKSKRHTYCQTRNKIKSPTENEKSSFRLFPVNSTTSFTKDMKNIHKTFKKTSNSRTEIFKIPPNRPCHLSVNNGAQEKQQNSSEYRSMISSIPQYHHTPVYSYPNVDYSQRNNDKRRISHNASTTYIQKSTHNLHTSNRRVSSGEEFVPSRIFPTEMRHKMKEAMSLSTKFCSDFDHNRAERPLMIPGDHKVIVASRDFYLETQHSDNVSCETVTVNSSKITVQTQTDWIIPPRRATDELNIMPEREIPPFCATYFSQMAQRSAHEMFSHYIPHKHPYQSNPDHLGFTNDINTFNSMRPALESQSTSTPRNSKSHRCTAHQTNPNLRNPSQPSGSYAHQSPDTRCNYSAMQIQNLQPILQIPRSRRMGEGQEEAYLNYFQRGPLNNRDNEISLLYDRHIPSCTNNQLSPITTPVNDRSSMVFENIHETPCNDSLNSIKDILNSSGKSISESVRRSLKAYVEHSQTPHNMSLTNEERKLQEKAKNRSRRYKLVSSHQYPYGLGTHLEPIEHLEPIPRRILKDSTVKSNIIQTIPEVGRLSGKEMSIKKRCSLQSRPTFDDGKITEFNHVASTPNANALSSSRFAIWHM